MKRLKEEVELRKVLNHLPVSKLRGGGVRGYYSGRITALVRAARADEREECAKVAEKEPGEVIVEDHCPACGVKLSIEYGDDEGEIVFLTKKGKSNEPERCSVSRARQNM